jgi:histidinol-phosphate aminotransferase
MTDIRTLLRKNIVNLKPYSSARHEFTGEASVFLDANENPYNHPYNRYPDPLQMQLKRAIGELKQVNSRQIFLGNGSDEPIDLLFRAFCEPGVDNVVSIDPTYGMYQVAADINDVQVRRVQLNEDFGLDVKGILKAIDARTKLLFICSPNNPSGNCFEESQLLELIHQFKGIVVLDEAYIDFAPGKSLLSKLNNYDNLVVLQTFSKAWGMAGIRLGMAFASIDIVDVLNTVKYPYNLNVLTQQTGLDLVKKEAEKEAWVKQILQERERVAVNLESLVFVQKVYPSDANFLLAKVSDPKAVYSYLVDKGIIVRDRSSVALCEGCLRITIGTENENNQLLAELNNYERNEDK